MKDIIVYVEGPSDRSVMEQLLKADIERALQGGCRIRFLPTEGKQRLVTQIPRRAADQLINDPHLEEYFKQSQRSGPLSHIADDEQYGEMVGLGMVEACPAAAAADLLAIEKARQLLLS